LLGNQLSPQSDSAFGTKDRATFCTVRTTPTYFELPGYAREYEAFAGGNRVSDEENRSLVRGPLAFFAAKAFRGEPISVGRGAESFACYLASWE
jgi:hypothetical protein